MIRMVSEEDGASSDDPVDAVAPPAPQDSSPSFGDTHPEKEASAETENGDDGTASTVEGEDPDVVGDVDDRLGGGAFFERKKSVVYESESTLITILPDYSLPYGGRRTIAAAKSLRSVNPTTEDVLRLNNEFNVLTRYLTKVPSARAALGRTAPARPSSGGGSIDGAAGVTESLSSSCSESPTLYLEWVEGSSLKEWVSRKRKRASDGLVGVEAQDESLLEDVRLMRDVAAALAAVNEAGVVHNDLSSENVIVREKGDGSDGFAVKLIDFGFASQSDAMESDDAGQTVNDDLYGLGLVFCEILIDSPIPDAVRDGMDMLMAPFFEDSGLPRRVVSVLFDMLEVGGRGEVNPYSCVREVVEDLEQMVEDPARFLHDPRTPEQVEGMGELAFIPHKLYGKHHEFTASLVGVFERTLVFPSLLSGSNLLSLKASTRHLIVPDVGIKQPSSSRSISASQVKSGCVLLPQVVLISGPAGSGKSHLARRIKEPLLKQGRVGGLFACVKYQKLRMNEPFSALTDAFNDLCDSILFWDEFHIDRIRNNILKAVGPEGRVLMSLVPKLRGIIGEPEGDLADLGGLEAQNRLKFVVRMFARAISQRDHPVALVLEDLQWADAASLDIITTLVTDPELRFFLFIGCYRPQQDLELSDEIAAKRSSVSSEAGDNRVSYTEYSEDRTVSSEHNSRRSVLSGRASRFAFLDGFAAFSAQLDALEEEEKLRITRIDIGNLDRQSMNEVLSDTLQMPRRLTQSLTERLFPRTQGNIFFTNECLKDLKDDGILSFDKEALRWKWNIDGLQRHHIPDSMVDLITGKIKKLSPETQGTLKLAACIGLYFDRRILELMSYETVDEMGSPVVSADDLQRHLDTLETEGFIETEANSMYVFAHNRIHHASYSLIHKRERNAMHLRIGEIMWESASEAQQKALLFIIVDHMNKGRNLVKGVDEKFQLAMLNIQAGEQCNAKSAFQTAVAYLKTGRKLLPRDHWGGNYDLSLRLFNSLIEAEQCNSRYEEMDSHLSQVFSHAKSFEQKLPAYKVLIRAYGARNQLQQAVDTGLDVLLRLGQSFPKSIPSMAEIGTDYIKTRMTLRGKNDEVLLKLPSMEDQAMLDAMQIMGSLVWYAYLSRQELVPLLAFRMIRLTVRHGISKIASFAFAMYGMILCGGMGDFKGGYRFGKLAMVLLEQFPAKEWAARVYGGTYYCIRHWSEPMQLSLEPFLQAHRVGLESGDIEYAFVIAHCYCCHAFQCGQSLVDLEEKAGEFCCNMEQHSQETILHTNIPIWQTALNLMGRSSDTMVLTGEAMDEGTMLAKAAMTGNTNAMYIIYFQKLVLACIFGDFNVASDMAVKTRDIGQVIMSSFFACDHAFYYGLTASALLQTREGRRWKKIARASKKAMKKMAKNAPSNCLHKYQLLKAELAGMHGSKASAKKYYDEAIENASRNGFLQDEAIANERASQYFKRCGDEMSASRYVASSHSCYMKWGAFGKADQLYQHKEQPNICV